MPAMHSAQDLQALKRTQLQGLCKRYGLKANGKNSELIERIIEHEQQEQGLQSGSDHAAKSSASDAAAEPALVVQPVDHVHDKAQLPPAVEPTTSDAAADSSTAASATHQPEALFTSTDAISVDPVPAATTEVVDAMDVDPQPMEQADSSLHVTLDLPAGNPQSESTDQAHAHAQPINAENDMSATSVGIDSANAIIDHYEQADMRDVYDALATNPQPKPDTESAMQVDAPTEVQALERADLSEVYTLASPPRSHATATPPRPSAITRTPPASTGLYPTIDVQRSLDMKLTFKWDPPAPAVAGERTPEKDASAVDDEVQSEPGSPCVEKVSRKSADLLKQAAKEEKMDVDTPAGQEQGVGRKENASGSGGQQSAETSKATKAAAAGANKIRPASSAPGLVPRVATLAKKPDGRPASSPRQTSTAASSASSRKLPASTSKPAAAAAVPPSSARLPSTHIPPPQRPMKRKATDDSETDQLPVDPTDAHVAKRLKALAPSVAAAVASSSRPVSTPGSATKIGGGGVKKSPGKPVFDLQASLKRKLNYVPKKGPLDKPAPGGSAAGASGAAGHGATSGLGKKVN